MRKWPSVDNPAALLAERAAMRGVQRPCEDMTRLTQDARAHRRALSTSS